MRHCYAFKSCEARRGTRVEQDEEPNAVPFHGDRDNRSTLGRSHRPWRKLAVDAERRPTIERRAATGQTASR